MHRKGLRLIYSRPIQQLPLNFKERPTPSQTPTRASSQPYPVPELAHKITELNQLMPLAVTHVARMVDQLLDAARAWPETTAARGTQQQRRHYPTT